MSRGKDLWTIIEAAVRNTRKRSPLNRGPYIITDEYLDECIARFDQQKRKDQKS